MSQSDYNGSSFHLAGITNVFMLTMLTIVEIIAIEVVMSVVLVVSAAKLKQARD